MTHFDGGAAFPRPLGNNGSTSYEDREVSTDAEGMTLRDWFAGQALSGLLASQAHPQSHGALTAGSLATFAEASYDLADALLARRAQNA